MKLNIIPTGYNKASPPPPADQFIGPTELGGAINAPLDAQGHNTYLGNKFYPFSQSQGFTPSTCASACLAQTQYDAAHPAADGSYMSCVSSPSLSSPKHQLTQPRPFSTLTSSPKTASPKASTAPSTTKPGTPPTPQTTANTAAVTATPSLALTHTPCPEAATAVPPARSETEISRPSR